jgi:hypothetical protein
MRPRQPEPEPNTRSSSLRVSKTFRHGSSATSASRPEQVEPGFEATARDHADATPVVGDQRQRTGLAIGRALGTDDDGQRECAASRAQRERRIDDRALATDRRTDCRRRVIRRQFVTVVHAGVDP